MKSNVKLRLAAFASLIVLLAAMIGGAAHLSWRQFEQLSARLSSSPIKSFRSADQFQATLQELNYLLLRYDVRHDEPDWNRFVEDGKNLDKWIDEQQPTLTTPRERALWEHINAAYDYYQSAAKERHHSIANPQEGSGPNDQTGKSEQECKPL